MAMKFGQKPTIGQKAATVEARLGATTKGTATGAKGGDIKLRPVLRKSDGGTIGIKGKISVGRRK